MRIAVCSPISFTNFSGASKFLIEAAKLLFKQGHDVTVYALPFGPNRTIDRSAVQSMLSPLHYVEAKKVEIDADLTYLNYVPIIWRKMKIKGPKIAGLHTHLLTPSQHFKQTLLHPLKAGPDWYAKAAGFALMIPAIKTDLLSFDAAHIPLGVFSTSHFTKLYQIPLWIDADRIPYREQSKELDKFAVLFVGRKTWEKGWFTFREVCSRLERAGYNFNFLCTGKGDGAIRGLGFLKEDELREAYQHSHVVVYPSIADVFGLVNLEAAACGVPVITTPINAHVQQGLPVVYAHDSASFMESILLVHSLWKERPEKYRAWCDLLRVRAEKYDVNKVFPVFESMLRNVAQRRSRKHNTRTAVGWTEPKVAFGHKSEKLSRNQRLRELTWASNSLAHSMSGLTLDIGAGKGYVATLLKEIGCAPVGLDIKPEFVKQMANAGLNSVLADGGHLPFQSSIFEQVTCFEMIEHVDDPEGVLGEIRRVLKYKGLLLLTTPSRNPVNVVIDCIRGEKTHVSEMPWRVLINTLTKYFRRIVYKPILSLPIPPSLLGRYYWFETDLFANHVWVCGEK